jgi:hypothetical protein
MLSRATLLVLLLSLLAAAPAGAALPPVKHVFIVVMENKNYEETFGNDTKASYLAKTLPAQGAMMPNYYATGHLSLDNYISMVSGQGPNPETQADSVVYKDVLPGTIGPDGQAMGTGAVYPQTVETIANQLEAKGLTWKGYMEDMANGPPEESKTCRHPEPNQSDPTQKAREGDQYAARHNPFVYFHSIIDFPTCDRNDVDYTQLAKDLVSPSTTPNYSFITPNLCHDGHDAPCVNGEPGGLESINDWLKKNIPLILGSPAYADGGLLIVTFDEAEAEPGGEGDASACCDEVAANTPNAGGPIPGPGGGKVGAVLLSPYIKPGTQVTKSYNHYSLLRSIEDIFGLKHLGYAESPNPGAFGADVYTRPEGPAAPLPKLRLRVRPRRLHVHERAKLRIRTGARARVRLRRPCGHRTRRADARGRLVLRVKPRRRGRCTITASRPGSRRAKRTIRVVA